MQKRNRVEAAEKDEVAHPVVKFNRRPKTSGMSKTPLTEKQREMILMENLLITKPERKAESAPVRKRGRSHDLRVKPVTT